MYTYFPTPMMVLMHIPKHINSKYNSNKNNVHIQFIVLQLCTYKWVLWLSLHILLSFNYDSEIWFMCTFNSKQQLTKHIHWKIMKILYKTIVPSLLFNWSSVTQNSQLYNTARTYSTLNRCTTIIRRFFSKCFSHFPHVIF